jgi:hypothetical protein
MASETAVQHPSPRRGTTEGRTVAFVLLAAPTAWALAHVITYAVASVACFPGHDPRSATDGLGWVQPLLIAVYVAGILIAAVGGFAAHRAWVVTRAEVHGEHKHAAEIGVGRARFMALWGMLSSGTFFLLMAFDAISSVMVPLCTH